MSALNQAAFTKEVPMLQKLMSCPVTALDSFSKAQQALLCLHCERMSGRHQHMNEPDTLRAAWLERATQACAMY